MSKLVVALEACGSRGRRDRLGRYRLVIPS